MKKYFGLIVLLFMGAALIACGDSPTTGTGEVQQNPNDTPTEAYKRLFAAVKSGDTAAIRQEFSKNSIAAAEAQAARMKVPVAEVYKNGFTRTTFADSLPEIRDERVSGNMGAIEVWSSTEGVWEDLPFIREESGWKLAVGDVFAGTWKHPGKGRAAREKEAANAVSGNTTIIEGMPGANVNVNRNATSPR